MNTIREVQSINEEELKRGIAGTRASWHTQYSNAAWIYVGNLDYQLVEGDVICVLSQYGEIGMSPCTNKKGCQIEISKGPSLEQLLFYPLTTATV